MLVALCGWVCKSVNAVECRILVSCRPSIAPNRKGFTRFGDTHWRQFIWIVEALPQSPLSLEVSLGVKKERSSQFFEDLRSSWGAAMETKNETLRNPLLPQLPFAVHCRLLEAEESCIARQSYCFSRTSSNSVTHDNSFWEHWGRKMCLAGVNWSWYFLDTVKVISFKSILKNLFL